MRVALGQGRIRAGLLGLLASFFIVPSVLATGAGAPGAWQTDTDLGMSTAVGSATVTSNGYIYKIGGDDSGTAVTTVQYAAINGNGTLGAWTATTSLPLAREWSSAVVNNGYIYTIAGSNGGSDVSTVYYAPLNSNGTIGSWTSTTAVPLAIRKGTAVIHNGYVYSIGGYNNGASFRTEVYYAPLNSNGTIGAWTATSALPIATSDAVSVTYNGYVYELAGFNGSFHDNAYYASFNANGTIGAWTATASLPAGMNLATGAQYNGYVYVLGGQNSGGLLDTVYYARLRDDGTIAGWQTAAHALPNQSFEVGAVAANGYLYEVGAYDNVASLAGVYYSALAGGTTTQSLTNAVNAAAVSITTPGGTDLTCSSSQTAGSQAKQDASYSYPLGLVNLCFTTPSVGNQVSVTFATSLGASQVVARHYNATTGIYSTIPGAVITQTTLLGRPALRVTYTVTDNGALDEDSATGAITDPVGLGVSTAPITGLGAPAPVGPLSWFLAVVSLVSLSGGAALIIRRQTR